MIPFDVSRCLEGQTTSEAYKTRTTVSLHDALPIWFENHIDPTSVLREKPRKPKDTRRKGETTAHDRPPSPPTGEPGYGIRRAQIPTPVTPRPPMAPAPRKTPWGRGPPTGFPISAF